MVFLPPDVSSHPWSDSFPNSLSNMQMRTCGFPCLGSSPDSPRPKE